MLDEDLATLYGVETKQLKRQVKRNIERFPDDFMLQLTKREYQDFLRCQFGTLEMGKYSNHESICKSAENKPDIYCFKEEDR